MQNRSLWLSLAATLAACNGTPGSVGEQQVGLVTTYKVGPGQQYPDLKSIASKVNPGDRVEVQGNATYASVAFDRPGTATAKITISGVRVNGKRPILSGGTNTVEMAGNHYVLEGFEITAGSSRCIFHHADDITVRDVVVHDCPGQGLLGADEDSGSLTLEYSEFYRNGEGDRKHQIYMSTDQEAYPGSVFRMQHCYVHDGNGGNNIKSRAERNEIFYNWVEGALYHELELIGSEASATDVVREDSDVVGNVFRKRTNFAVTRFGGDGTADTNGRYRFVNNTVVTAGTSGVFRLFDGIQSLEMHNNVFVRQGGGAVTLLSDGEVSWTDGKQVIAGANNWVASGTATPAGWSKTLQGGDPGLTDVNGGKLWPTPVSSLLAAGTASPTSPSGYAFPNPLPLPLSEPPRGALEAVGAAPGRINGGAPDIGAFPSASGSAPAPTPTPTPPVPTPTPMPTACNTIDVLTTVASTQEAENPAPNANDGNLATRWSGLGIGATLTFDLGANHPLCGLDLAWFRGDARSSSFSIAVSSDGQTFTNVFSGKSSGTSAAAESYRFNPTSGRYLRLIGNGNTQNQWNSVSEAAVRAGS